MGWFGPASGACSCCGEVGNCTCRNGVGGSIIPVKTLRAVIGGGGSTDGSSALGCDTTPSCPADPTGTYDIACGDFFEFSVYSSSCLSNGSTFFSAGSEVRYEYRVLHTSAAQVTSTGLATPTEYNIDNGGGVIVVEGNVQVNTSPFGWARYCCMGRTYRQYVWSTPIGDECPTFSPGFSVQNYAANRVAGCFGCNVQAGFTIVLSQI